jgi:hypothetical protein
VLSLDFEQAFDRLSHHYLFEIVRSFGVSDDFCNVIKALYEQAEALVKTNGSLSGAVTIRCWVRQGCPLSMVLYAMCVHQLLLSLEGKLPAIRIGRHGAQCPVIAYADDIIFVTRPTDLVLIQQSIQTYERASGAKLNAVKSQALAVANWATQPTTLGIQLQDRATILGISFGRTIARSMDASWERFTQTVRAQARKEYSGQMCVATRIHFAQQRLLAKLWYTAQILPLPQCYARQLATIMSCFI